MTFLIWFFGIWLGIWVVLRLFGRKILAFGMTKLVNRLQKEAQAQRQAYEGNYQAGPMREHVYADEEVKVTSPRNASREQVKLDDIAQDVDFEEVSER